MRKIISRTNPNVLPELALPVYVRSTGYNEAEPGWSESGGRKSFVQFFWCTQGIGEFRFADRQVLLHPGEVIYRLPHEEHQHRSADAKTPWHYYWFTLDGPGAVNFVQAYSYPQHAMYAGACPEELFHELEIFLPQYTDYAQRHILSVAAEILALMGNKPETPEHDAVKHFLNMAGQNFADSAFDTQTAAKELRIHRTTLYRLVKQHLTMSPKQFLLQLRIQKALTLLLTTDCSVKEIAGRTGFNKVDYFCAQIARKTGFTPAKYRKHASKDSI